MASVRLFNDQKTAATTLTAQRVRQLVGDLTKLGNGAMRDVQDFLRNEQHTNAPIVKVG